MSRTMPMALGWAIFLAFSGCAEYVIEAGGDRDPAFDDDDAAGDDDAADDDAGCAIVGTVPVDGDPTVYYRNTLQVFFDEPVDAANLSLEDDTGTVPGTLELDEDGLWASFDPYGNDPLQHLLPLTDYRARVDAPGCSADWTFTTSALGADLLGGVVFEDARYVVHLEQATLVKPAGMAPLLEPFGLDAFLLTVDEIAPGELSLTTGGVTLDNFDLPVQDPCTVTVELTLATSATLTGAHMTLPPTDLTLTVQPGLYLELLSVSLDAEFTQDGDWLEEGRVSGWVDGFALDQVLTELNGEPGTGTCQTLDQLGSSCEACPGSPEQLTCIQFEWQDIRGELVGNHLALADVSEADLTDCSK